jgi:beta-phosphoglucomutase-like phosphatase (HAD superfamily)
MTQNATAVVLFDVDGTLVDQMGDELRTLRSEAFAPMIDGIAVVDGATELLLFTPRTTLRRLGEIPLIVPGGWCYLVGDRDVVHVCEASSRESEREHDGRTVIATRHDTRRGHVE